MLLLLFVLLFIQSQFVRQKQKMFHAHGAPVVKYSILIKSPLRGSSDLIYKVEQRTKKEKKTNLQMEK